MTHDGGIFAEQLLRVSEDNYDIGRLEAKIKKNQPEQNFRMRLLPEKVSLGMGLDHGCTVFSKKCGNVIYFGEREFYKNRDHSEGFASHEVGHVANEDSKKRPAEIGAIIGAAGFSAVSGLQWMLKITKGLSIGKKIGVRLLGSVLGAGVVGASSFASMCAVSRFKERRADQYAIQHASNDGLHGLRDGFIDLQLQLDSIVKDGGRVFMPFHPPIGQRIELVEKELARREAVEKVAIEQKETAEFKKIDQ